ncbi:MAG TPA: DUF3303 family protein [Dehalococcoidia bacterium]|nr:DUF3303 family protein [Dehalococcoidia bacterium]
MLFHIIGDFIDTSDEGSACLLAVFSNRQPPENAGFKDFYGFADSAGGAAIIKAPDAAMSARATAPFTPWLQLDARPILPVEESAAIGGEALAFIGNTGWRCSKPSTQHGDGWDTFVLAGPSVLLKYPCEGFAAA